MKRRNLIKTLALGGIGMQLYSCTNKIATTAAPLASVSQSSKKISLDRPIVKPRALNLGDTIGIVAPGTNDPTPEAIEKFKEVCEWLGLNLIISPYLRSEFGYKTRTPQTRAKELMEMFVDDNIDGIFCVRGGYGCQQILNLLDYDLIRQKPKIFAGYSDITALHIAINQYSRLLTFHAPVMLSKFTTFTANHLKEILFSVATYPLLLDNPDNKSGIRDVYPTRTINSGVVRGEMVGGNLSLVSALMGTPYQIDCRDKILFLEDVGEAPYSIDRMLGQLDLGGVLQQAKGIVFGKCEGCSGNTSTWDSSLGEVLDYYFKHLGIPAFYGLLFGHSSNQLTMPELSMIELNADEQTISILENPVIV